MNIEHGPDNVRISSCLVHVSLAVCIFLGGYILHGYPRNIWCACPLINCMYLGKWGLYLQLVAEVLIFSFTT